MRGTIIEAILSEHLVSGTLAPGEEVGLRIDQTLTQDATGTMAYLQFETLGLDRVRTELSVSYVDHNTLQTGFENADDHRYLQTVAARYGIYFSRPGNGICHQVHLERFAVPGKTLLGSDSHTPTAGGLGMVAIGAGGLDVALAMAGQPFYVRAPEVVGVQLNGQLPDWVSAQDVILHLLGKLTVSGGVGKALEYFGDGVDTLSGPQRATITNMGTELGATTSIFPSDATTRRFLHAQQRQEVWRPLSADEDAEYAQIIEVNLSELEPLIAQPHSPDNVVPVGKIAGTRVNQVCIGSCTNSSLAELMTVAAMLRGKQVHPDVSVTVSPGSRQVLTMLARSGALADLLAAGVRLLEAACGPCIGMGQAPATDAVSLRSFNRNFSGRSGTKSAQVYLASPVVCAAAALTGEITDPRTLGEVPHVDIPERFAGDDSMIIGPAENGSEVEVYYGPNIKPVPTQEPLAAELEGTVLLKVGDDITTDHIMPAGAKLLPLRSNIPAISQHVFAPVDTGFAERAQAHGGGFIVGGDNYGQGSSREHAALAPAYLGVKAVLACSFARIHQANLVNFGILPLQISKEDYQRCQQGDQLQIKEVDKQMVAGQPLVVDNISQDYQFTATAQLSQRQIEIIRAGGALNWARQKLAGAG